MNFIPVGHESVRLEKVKYNTSKRNLEIDAQVYFQPHPDDEENRDAPVVTTSINIVPHTRVHRDLERAFGALKMHAIFIIEHLDETAYDLEIFKDYALGRITEDSLRNQISKIVLTGVGFKNNEENPDQAGVYFTGHKILRTKYVVNFVTPTIKLETQKQEPYKFLRTLNQDLNTFKQEVTLYLQGKWECEDGQLDLFAPAAAIAL